jgi:hypothetical protein
MMPDALSRKFPSSASKRGAPPLAETQRLIRLLPTSLKARLLVDVLEQKKTGNHRVEAELDRIASQNKVPKSHLLRAILAEFLAEVRPGSLAAQPTANTAPRTRAPSKPASPKASPPPPVQKEHPRVAAAVLTAMERQQAATSLRTMTSPMARATARALRDIETRRQQLPAQSRQIIGSEYQ